jgi:DNA-binding NarL/FixJ family response regulator
MTAGTAIRVAVVEDDRSTREGLGTLIEGTAGYACVGLFGSVEDALSGLAGADPDVMLLDIQLPGRPGSEGVRHFRERHPRTQVVMLTAFDDDARIFESLCNGACGYILKKMPPNRLLEAVREAHEGGAPMSPEIARKVVATFRVESPPPRPPQALTPQEQRLLRILAEGATYREAGDRLGITANTVRNYIRSIYDKLQVHSKSEAVVKALRGRVIS